MKKRSPDIVVISDLHLGTYDCRAAELVNYLRSITTQILILNGDIIDGWQFKKGYFPAMHLQVIKEILNLITAGTKVFYITGNHDEVLRRYRDLSLHNFHLTDKMVLELNGQLTWIFHGNVFDRTTLRSARIIGKLGGYDLLIRASRLANWWFEKIGRPKMSLSQKIKNSEKKAVKWISDFEQIAAELAIKNKYDVVICGHIHQPQKRTIETKQGRVVYLNSGDWVENLTALEYSQKEWTLYRYDESLFSNTPVKLMNNRIPELSVVTDELYFFFNILNPKL